MDIVKMEEDAPPPAIKQEGISLPGLNPEIELMGIDAPMEEVTSVNNESNLPPKNRKIGLTTKFRTPEEEAKRHEKMANRKLNRAKKRAGDSYRPSSLLDGGYPDRITTEFSDRERDSWATLGDPLRRPDPPLRRYRDRRYDDNGSRRDRESPPRRSLADLYRLHRQQHVDSYRPAEHADDFDRYQPDHDQVSSESHSYLQPKIVADFAGVPRGPRNWTGQSKPHGEVIKDEDSNKADFNAPFAGVPTVPRADQSVKPLSNYARRRQAYASERLQNVEVNNQSLDLQRIKSKTAAHIDAILVQEAKDLAEDIWEDLPDSSVGHVPTLFLPQPSVNDIANSQNGASTYTSERVTRLEKKRRQEKLQNRRAKRASEMDVDELGDLFTSASLHDAKKLQSQPHPSSEKTQPKPKKSGSKATKHEKKLRRFERHQQTLANRAHTKNMSKEDKEQFYLDLMFRDWAVRQEAGYDTRAHFDAIRQEKATRKHRNRENRQARLTELEGSIAKKLMADEKENANSISESSPINTEQIKRDTKEILQATAVVRHRMYMTAEALEGVRNGKMSKEETEEKFRKDRDAAEAAMEEKIRQIRMKNKLEGLTKDLGNLLAPECSEHGV